MYTLREIRVPQVILRAVLLAALCTTVTVFIATAGTHAHAAQTDLAVQGSTQYLAKAQEQYGISSDRVLEASSIGNLKKKLDQAAKSATDANRYIVHLPSGSYSISKTIVVPKNVLLVCDSNTRISTEASLSAMVYVAGSVYGGSFSGKKCRAILKYQGDMFGNDNGIIEKAVITRSGFNGIEAIHGLKNMQIIGCKITSCTGNGISVLDGAYIKLISNTITSNNGYSSTLFSGINLSHASVGTIRNCTINNNADKAISTNSDAVVGYKQPGCTIGAIIGCTMKGNKNNGVYIKPKCTVNRFENNVLIGNKDGIAAVAVTPNGTKGKSVIRNVVNNTFKTSKFAQIKATGKGAVITLGKGNKIINGKLSGIAVQDRGIVTISGSNNRIANNKDSGLNARRLGKITIKGANNTVTQKTGFAIYCKDKGIITLKDVKLTGRIYTKTGGKVKRG